MAAHLIFLAISVVGSGIIVGLVGIIQRLDRLVEELAKRD